MHTVILGAGITGLTAAYRLHEVPECTYAVYEQGSRSGGYCQSERHGGFLFDIVSHVLHFRSKETENLLHTLLDANLLNCRRNAAIYFRGRHVPYPFQANLRYLPRLAGMECLTGYLKAWWKRSLNGTKQPESFQEWIHHHLGDGIARHFMVPYNRKLWGMPLSELDVSWVRPFVPRTLGREVLLNLLFRSENEVGYNSRFHYPAQGGMQSLIDALAKRISPVQTNHQVVSVDLERKVVQFPNGEQTSYDRLVSTIPLTNLAEIAVGLPEDLRRDAQQFVSTSLLSLIFCTRHPLAHSFHWLYFPEPEFPFFRLVFPSNLCPSLAPSGSSIIAVEISEPDLSQQEALEAACREMLLKLGYIPSPNDIEYSASYFFRHAYPVPVRNAAGCATRLKEFFRSKDVWSVGRFGSWRYSSIDDAIVEGTQAAQEIAQTVSARRARAAGVGAS